MSTWKKQRNRFLRAAIILLMGMTLSTTVFSEPDTKSAIYNVRDFGAVGDGRTSSTAAIQKAINNCAENGGGAVLLSAGSFLSGTIYLKSNVALHLSAGSVLLGSTNLEDYPVTVQAFRSYTDNYTNKSLIYGENLQNVTIEGSGVIDGQGAAFKGPYKVRPYLIRLVTCQNVLVKDVTLKDSPMWVQHYLACDDVHVRGVTVRSRVNHNNDGINIDCCHRVCVSDCNIWSGDDAIVLKSTASRACENVVITNSVLSSLCNAIKMGTESNGGFKNVVVTGCSIYNTNLAGIALEIVDGGVLDQVVVSGITMRNVRVPIFLRLGDRARPYKKDVKRPSVGVFRNVTISDIEASASSNLGCSITGLPNHEIENVTLSNIRISVPGGGTEEDAKKAVPEKPEAYPECTMFGTLPAYGFYCRHVRGLRLRNVQLTCREPDMRPALVFDDVQRAEIEALHARCMKNGSPLLRLIQVKEVFIRGCVAPTGMGTFLRLEGDKTAQVSLIGNDLSLARNVVEKSPEVPSGALREITNVVGEN
jgi:polygalacturonase